MMYVEFYLGGNNTTFHLLSGLVSHYGCPSDDDATANTLPFYVGIGFKNKKQRDDNKRGNN